MSLYVLKSKTSSLILSLHLSWHHTICLHNLLHYMFYRAIRRLLAIPFLPAEHTFPTFQHLQQKVQWNESVARLHEYVENTWFQSAFPPEVWSVYGRAIRPTIWWKGGITVSIRVPEDPTSVSTCWSGYSTRKPNWHDSTRNWLLKERSHRNRRKSIGKSLVASPQHGKSTHKETAPLRNCSRKSLTCTHLESRH